MTQNPKPNRLEQALGHNAGVLAQFTEEQVKASESRIVAAMKEAVGEAKAEIIKAAGYPERKIDAAYLWLAHRKYTLLWTVGLIIAANLLGLAVLQGAGCIEINP